MSLASRLQSSTEFWERMQVVLCRYTDKEECQCTDLSCQLLLGICRQKKQTNLKTPNNFGYDLIYFVKQMQ